MTLLSLLTIRSRSPLRSVGFYRQLGLNFEEHQHGNGPVHWCALIGSTAFEIYPCTGDTSPTAETRLGFCVEDLQEARTRILDAGGSVMLEPEPSPWGMRMVVVDPDGHRVELTRATD